MKTFSLARIAPVLFTCLVGCGGGAAAAPPASAPPPPPVAAPPAPPPAPPAPPPAAFTTSTATDSTTPDVPPMTASGATLTWYGHAAFKLVTPSGKVIWFDPWITNPKNPTGKDDLAKIDKADLILVSHGHFDHVGDAVAIAKKTHAKLVSTFDLGRAIVAYDGYPKDGAGFDSQGNVGGDISFFNGEVTVSFVPAVHSSSASPQDAKGNPFGDLRPGGEAGGFVVTIKGGPVVYHTGDTDLFGDMALIGKYHKVNVMLACVGDHFTMGPERAAEAARLVGPSVIVPMHYGTFPILTGTPEALEDAVKTKGLHSQVHTMKVHEEMKL
jgi:L-ascorbate metabolism protein UlaG (beta-lactamase superfamily)